MNQTQILDPLLYRYSNIDFVLELPYLEGFELFQKCCEMIFEENAYKMWLAKYQHMDKNNYVSFGDFLKQLKIPQQENNDNFNKKIDKCKKIAEKHKSKVQKGV